MTVHALDPRADVTKIQTGITDENRADIADGLRHVLGDTYLLIVKTHAYHWNVVGPLFVSIHELTEKHYENMFGAADELAERIRALGHLAPVNFKSLAGDAGLTEEAEAELTAREMVGRLVEDHERLIRRARALAERAESADDFATHDLLVERIDFHEGAAWMLRAIIAE